jgi:hypothetical protein
MIFDNERLKTHYLFTNEPAGNRIVCLILIPIKEKEKPIPTRSMPKTITMPRLAMGLVTDSWRKGGARVLYLIHHSSWH